ncbi:MAG: peptidoglycan-binding protein LysM [Thermoanaerobaculia bacterium]
MGLLDFVKNAGAKIFGGDDDDAAAKAAADAEARAQRRKLERAKKERILLNHLKAMGIEVEDPKVGYERGVVTLGGKVATQADAEKAALTVGNVQGVEAVNNKLEVTNPEPEAQYHTVVSGDTLSGIAKKHYGNAMKYPAIFEANKPMLSDPDKIYPGQVLRIPPLGD